MPFIFENLGYPVNIDAPKLYSSIVSVAKAVIIIDYSTHKNCAVNRKQSAAIVEHHFVNLGSF